MYNLHGGAGCISKKNIMNSRITTTAICFMLAGFAYMPLIKGQGADTLWLQKIDLTRFTQDFNLVPKAYLKLQSDPLFIGGSKFHNGLASHSEALLRIKLDGKAQKFYSLTGLDDSSNKKCRTVLKAFADEKEVYKSPVMKAGKNPVSVEIDLKGVKNFELVLDDDGTGVYSDQVNFANAFISYLEEMPVVFNFNYINKRHILTPPESPYPKINGARVFGVRPGHPFLYRIPASGKRPMTFAVEKLPAGLSLDSTTGIITGDVQDAGEYHVVFKAFNELGNARREFKIVVGEKIALTPPMGWNSYNRFGDSIDQATVKIGVDAMVKSGLVNYGWNYINIDDSWSVKPGSKDSMRMGEARDANGMINTNKKFPDFNALTDYIHANGFKAGLYSSPGKLTCTGYTASYQFEEKDARRWADWGFDYIKYDYCQYGEITGSKSLDALQKPYIVMRNALDKIDRDIFYSISQYGAGDVWEWGEKIGANSWRTTGDLIDTWQSLSETGFTQAGIEKFAGPGHWNDPDMLVVGLVGWGEWQYPSRLTADEQYTHMSLWSLLAAPLLIGCDVAAMDDFTRNLFTNDEVIAINQDPLGKQASRIYKQDGLEVWARQLEDGTRAVGLFNRNETTETVTATWSALGLKGMYSARDVWRQRNEGIFSKRFTAIVPAHGVKLVILQKDE